MRVRLILWALLLITCNASKEWGNDRLWKCENENCEFSANWDYFDDCEMCQTKRNPEFSYNSIEKSNENDSDRNSMKIVEDRIKVDLNKLFDDEEPAFQSSHSIKKSNENDSNRHSIKIAEDQFRNGIKVNLIKLFDMDEAPAFQKPTTDNIQSLYNLDNEQDLKANSIVSDNTSDYSVDTSDLHFNERRFDSRIGSYADQIDHKKVQTVRKYATFEEADQGRYKAIYEGFKWIFYSDGKTPLTIMPQNTKEFRQFTSAEVRKWVDKTSQKSQIESNVIAAFASHLEKNKKLKKLKSNDKCNIYLSYPKPTSIPRYQHRNIEQQWATSLYEWLEYRTEWCTDEVIQFFLDCKDIREKEFEATKFEFELDLKQVNAIPQIIGYRSSGCTWELLVFFEDTRFYHGVYLETMKAFGVSRTQTNTVHQLFFPNHKAPLPPNAAMQYPPTLWDYHPDGQCTKKTEHFEPNQKVN